jgi:amino acid transporter
VVFTISFLTLIAGFVLGLVYVGEVGRAPFSLTSKSQGAHAIIGLVAVVFATLLFLVRMFKIVGDAKEPNEGSFKTYDLVGIFCFLLGIIVVYLGIFELDTDFWWYAVYGGYLLLVVVIFTVGEILRRKKKKQEVEEA